MNQPMNDGGLYRYHPARSKTITVNGVPAIDTTAKLADTAIMGIPARGVETDRSGRLFLGHLYADPENPDQPTLWFTYAGGGESDEYKISPCDGYPGRTLIVGDMAAVIERAVEWVEQAWMRDALMQRERKP